MRRISSRLALAGALWLLGAPFGPAAAAAPGSAAVEAREAAARPGAFCTSSRCAPRTASPAAKMAGFGATALAALWIARRREPLRPE